MRRKIRNPSILKEIALFAVSLFGKRMTFQSVAKTVGLNGINTAKNYLSYLEESYLISTVLPYSEKIKEQIRLPRKIYVMDNAIATSLSTRSTEDSGPLLECIVYQELRRRKAEIWTYLSPKVEVDFLIRQGRKVTQLVQSCWSLNNSNTQTREIHALCEAAKSTGCRDLLIITRDEKQTLIQNGYRIQVIPVIEWLLAGSDQYNS
jgi:predicted AAA+ superfamily ATPase